jgi:anti-sigma regulatory factor (Ser/Thr protein kinase)
VTLRIVIDVCVEAVAEAPGRARRELRALDGALASARAADAQLLVSELVTNAVMHARGEGGIRLRVRLAPDRLRVEVYDPGRGFVPTRPPPRPPPEHPHGRGIYLLERMADRWSSASTRAGHCVWFELDRD